jgi:hypothetical protein
MVDMTNRPDVQVRLVPLELLLGHGITSAPSKPDYGQKNENG